MSGEFLVVTPGVGECYWHLACGGQGAATHPTMHGAAPAAENYPAPGVNGNPAQGRQVPPPRQLSVTTLDPDDKPEGMTFRGAPRLR